MLEKGDICFRTHIGKDMRVTTIHRAASIAMAFPPWFYETIVWRGDKRLNVINSGSSYDQAIHSHVGIVKNIIRSQKEEPTDEA